MEGRKRKDGRKEGRWRKDERKVKDGMVREGEGERKRKEGKEG